MVRRNFKVELNRILPTAGAMKLGDVLENMALQHNKLVTDITALRTTIATQVTKMNADAGITDTNYAAPAAITAAAVPLISAL